MIDAVKTVHLMPARQIWELFPAVQSCFLRATNIPTINPKWLSTATYVNQSPFYQNRALSIHQRPQLQRHAIVPRHHVQRILHEEHRRVLLGASE